MATLSILGLYNVQPTIFDGLALPDGVDHETIVWTIIEKCAELEILFANPTYMERAILMWSRRNLQIWTKLLATTTLEYNPITNYDRTEEWEDSGNRENVANSKGNSVGKTSGYNSNELVDSNGADTRVENSGNEKTNGKHKGRMWGNIGVTTTQQMIEEERKVVKFDIYDYIAECFKAEFCLMIY